MTLMDIKIILLEEEHKLIIDFLVLVDVLGVKDLENASVYIQKMNLINLRIRQSQRLSGATFLMSFYSLRLWVLMTY